jgi:hypothetical protein
MQPQKPKRIHVVLLIFLIAAGAVFVVLYVTSRASGARLLPELYVAGILICAILLAFLLLTRVGPALLFNSAKSKLLKFKSTEGECATIEPEGLKERISQALQKDGFKVAQTQITPSGSDSLRVTVALSKAFSLFYDRMYRYVIITEDFRKTRDFDTLGRYAQSLIDAEELSDDVRARSGFSTVVVLLMTHVPEQVQAACREEAVAEGPAYVPVACDMTSGKAYYLAGKPVGLLEFRRAQKIINKYIIGKSKK